MSTDLHPRDWLLKQGVLMANWRHGRLNRKPGPFCRQNKGRMSRPSSPIAQMALVTLQLGLGQ
jgi:hypothetical protein